MHIKRKAAPVMWGLPRKGTKYLARPSHEPEEGVPLIIVLRDLLNQVRNAKELKKVLNDKKVQINGKIIRDIKYPVMLFDSISFPETKKYFRVVLRKKRISFVEISESQSKKRVYQIVNKTLLKNKKIQLNLNYGKNIIVTQNSEVGDFIVLENSSNKILETIKMKKGLEVVVIMGKHLGRTGFIESIDELGGKKILTLKNKKENEEFKVEINNVYVIYRDE